MKFKTGTPEQEAAKRIMEAQEVVRAHIGEMTVILATSGCIDALAKPALAPVVRSWDAFLNSEQQI